jgi:hypothetical protein
MRFQVNLLVRSDWSIRCKSAALGVSFPGAIALTSK